MNEVASDASNDVRSPDEARPRVRSHAVQGASPPGATATRPLDQLERVVLLLTAPVANVAPTQPSPDGTDRHRTGPGERIDAAVAAWTAPAARAFDTDSDVRDAAWRVLVEATRQPGPSAPIWTVLVAGLALPSLHSVADAIVPAESAERAEVESAVLTGFVDHLGALDLDEPHLLDRLVTAARRRACRPRAHSLPPRTTRRLARRPVAPSPPWRHPDLVLVAAVSAGILAQDEARLIGCTRLEDIPLRRVAALWGTRPDQLRSRRDHAERRLRRAILAGDLDTIGA